MSFDPLSVDEDATGGGSLDDTPIYDILFSIFKKDLTGRLSVNVAEGQNQMFFMRGQPVGVQLAEFYHPLGQLLLELGRIDAEQFLVAQRKIASGNRLPGQVFMEIGTLDEAGLREVLAVQARRKAEAYCAVGSGGFEFARGLMFLSGFNSTPLNMHAVLYLALKQHMGPAVCQAFLEQLQPYAIQLEEGPALLPAPLPEYGFGPSEERFLQRLRAAPQDVKNLTDTGTLPADEAAVLLRYLHVAGLLRRGEHSEVAEAAAALLAEETPMMDMAALDEPLPAPAPAPLSAPLPAAPPPVAKPAAAPAPLPDEVFASLPAGVPAPVKKVAPKALTDPNTSGPPSDIHDVPTAEAGGASSIIVSPELMTATPPTPRRKKKKRRKRRAAPEPSIGESAMTETRRERMQEPDEGLPSIVISDD